jgi:hypothetical protein
MNNQLLMNNQIVTAETFVVAMPNDAAPLGFDPFSDGFTWHDVLPANYWNLDLLEEKVAALGGNPVVTPARIVIQTVVDPEVPELQQDKSPKLVMEFVENVPALVMNKTRCTLATKLTGTPNPARWAKAMPALELYAGAYRDMAAAMQILFRPVAAPKPTAAAKPAANGKPVPNSKRGIPTDGDALNDDLFG